MTRLQYSVHNPPRDLIHIHTGVCWYRLCIYICIYVYVYVLCIYEVCMDKTNGCVWIRVRVLCTSFSWANLVNVYSATFVSTWCLILPHIFIFLCFTVDVCSLLCLHAGSCVFNGQRKFYTTPKAILSVHYIHTLNVYMRLNVVKDCEADIICSEDFMVTWEMYSSVLNEEFSQKEIVDFYFFSFCLCGFKIFFPLHL